MEVFTMDKQLKQEIYTYLEIQKTRATKEVNNALNVLQNLSSNTDIAYNSTIENIDKRLAEIKTIISLQSRL